jgi:hypothetical protein
MHNKVEEKAKEGDFECMPSISTAEELNEATTEDVVSTTLIPSIAVQI